MTRYEIEKERENLRSQILSAREHIGRTVGEEREANRAYLRSVITARREFNQKFQCNQLSEH